MSLSCSGFSRCCCDLVALLMLKTIPFQFHTCAHTHTYNMHKQTQTIIFVCRFIQKAATHIQITQTHLGTQCIQTIIDILYISLDMNTSRSVSWKYACNWLTCKKTEGRFLIINISSLNTQVYPASIRFMVQLLILVFALLGALFMFRQLRLQSYLITMDTHSPYHHQRLLASHFTGTPPKQTMEIKCITAYGILILLNALRKERTIFSETNDAPDHLCLVNRKRLLLCRATRWHPDLSYSIAKLTCRGPHSTICGIQGQIAIFICNLSEP